MVQLHRGIGAEGIGDRSVAQLSVVAVETIVPDTDSVAEVVLFPVPEHSSLAIDESLLETAGLSPEATDAYQMYLEEISEVNMSPAVAAIHRAYITEKDPYKRNKAERAYYEAVTAERDADWLKRMQDPNYTPVPDDEVANFWSTVTKDNTILEKISGRRPNANFPWYIRTFGDLEEIVVKDTDSLRLKPNELAEVRRSLAERRRHLAEDKDPAVERDQYDREQERRRILREQERAKKLGDASLGEASPDQVPEKIEQTQQA